MGCLAGERDCIPDDERPLHPVQITKPFGLGRFEVTQQEWTSIMGVNPSHFEGTNRPVENVSWYDVQSFMAKLNGRGDGYKYRLPTEAEWEYAARAGSTGSRYGDLNDIAWYYYNAGNQTHPVGQKQPNAWGLYDMIGNVWEWVQDYYSSNYYLYSPVIDPPGPSAGSARVLRGSAWNIDYSWGLSVARRGGDVPDSLSAFSGFRCLREKLKP